MWLNSLHNPQAIHAVYGDTVPSLTPVNLHEFSIDRDGPTVRLRFDLPDFPTNPPPKWQDFTVVQLCLSIAGVRECTVSGIGTDIVGTLSVERREGVAVTFESADLTFAVTGEALVLDGISAYLDS